MANWILTDHTLRVNVPADATEDNVIITAVRRAIEHPAFGPGLNLLIDARLYDSAAVLRISPDELRNRAASISRLGFKQCALVVAPAPPKRRIADMFATYAEEYGLETCVFEDVDEAERWLARAVPVTP
jgi:hypothetical protein